MTPRRPADARASPRSMLTQTDGQGAVPVLAFPQAAAYFGGQAGSTILAQEGLPTMRVRVAGELQSTPALPGGGPFIVLPTSAIRGVSGPPVNLMLLTGSSINMTRLNAVVQPTAPGAYTPSITTRSAALRALTQAPLQQGTFLLFTLAIAYAAALALAVMLLQLALGSADRELTTARLATMGLTEGQRVRLVALEVVPSIAASAAAAAACAIALPRLLAPAIDLSVFTQSQAATPLLAQPLIGRQTRAAITRTAGDCASRQLRRIVWVACAAVMLVSSGGREWSASARQARRSGLLSGPTAQESLPRPHAHQSTSAA
jgi:hypothetical protein